MAGALWGLRQGMASLTTCTTQRCQQVKPESSVFSVRPLPTWSCRISPPSSLLALMAPDFGTLCGIKCWNGWVTGLIQHSSSYVLSVWLAAAHQGLRKLKMSPLQKKKCYLRFCNGRCQGLNCMNYKTKTMPPSLKLLERMGSLLIFPPLTFSMVDAFSRLFQMIVLQCNPKNTDSLLKPLKSLGLDGCHCTEDSTLTVFQRRKLACCCTVELSTFQWK